MKFSCYTAKSFTLWVSGSVQTVPPVSMSSGGLYDLSEQRDLEEPILMSNNPSRKPNANPRARPERYGLRGRMK